jgi:hypothetical protein
MRLINTFTILKDEYKNLTPVDVTQTFTNLAKIRNYFQHKIDNTKTDESRILLVDNQIAIPDPTNAIINSTTLQKIVNYYLKMDTINVTEPQFNNSTKNILKGLLQLNEANDVDALYNILLIVFQINCYQNFANNFVKNNYYKVNRAKSLNELFFYDTKFDTILDTYDSTKPFDPSNEKMNIKTYLFSKIINEYLNTKVDKSLIRNPGDSVVGQLKKYIKAELNAAPATAAVTHTAAVIAAADAAEQAAIRAIAAAVAAKTAADAAAAAAATAKASADIADDPNTTVTDAEAAAIAANTAANDAGGAAAAAAAEVTKAFDDQRIAYLQNNDAGAAAAAAETVALPDQKANQKGFDAPALKKANDAFANADRALTEARAYSDAALASQQAADQDARRADAAVTQKKAAAAAGGPVP